MDLKLHLLETITNNFSEDQKVGSGGYGDVYKGVLDGEEIAVKKLHPLQGLDDERFENEFRNLSSIHHENVVSLIGYCYGTRNEYIEHNGKLIFAKIEERIICSEYMHGGSLDKHIADESCQLDWPTCYRIIKGTCDGLNHLHTMLIYHLDLKPSNILLDNTMKPKISDLGLSRLVSSTKSYKTERIMGTAGYMPPEYIDGGLTSNKFDVFSLGITIIKILAGNVGYLRCSEMSPKDFIEFVRFHWMKRSQAMPDILRVITCVEIALRCVELDRKKRPHIENIVNELEEVEVEINKIMLLPPDRWQILLTNQGPDLGFPKISRLCIAHNLVPSISIHLIEAITNNFSDDQKVGSGGSGDVYKGVLDGEEIAVKKLHPLQGLDDERFENEFRNLSSIHHENVVSLIGYCYGTRNKYIEHNGELIFAKIEERIICSEYMHGGSLDKHIADESCQLDWPTCYRIIKGTCDGLNHLHTMLIYHLDLKPSNILLDNTMKPKISDLGLSRLVSLTKSYKTKRIMGTAGYMPPEYIDGGLTSNKFDVFSLGITIIKILAGNVGYFRCSEMSPKDFIKFVRFHWMKRSQAMPDILRVISCVEIALRCVELDPKKRPHIENIVNELEEMDFEINEIMLLPPDRWQILLTNQGPDLGFPKISRLCIAHNLVPSISIHLIAAITNNFSDDQKVGSGGYGDVYKGVLDGEEIAVKKLHPLQGLDDERFENEFRNLSSIHHENVVSLIGYCYGTRNKYIVHNGELIFAKIEERIICSEYMHGGSLDKHIADESCQLDWPTCYRIIKGTCDGLNHLHTMLIYHLDLKPSNILLDNTMKPKISDLGLSRLVSLTKSYKTERIMGTAGYMPPEYIDEGLTSNKFDVFSLGITIIKILAGNVGYLRCSEMSLKDFIEFVRFHWMKRSQAMPDVLRVITCVEIALRCVELDRKKRPHIANIVNELEEVEVEINKIMLLPPNRWQILLTNQGPDLGFPKISRLCIAHNLVQSNSIHLIEAITNNFSDDHKIGSDWYGDVYWAVYNGEEIAVKKLHSLQGLDDKDFENEMRSLTKVRHKNVGRLVGYFYEPRHMKIENNEELVRTRTMEPILCFEYMQGRSLDKHIADEPCGLDWPILYKIIKGTCKGLNHLLSAQERPILHLNLTPANIFLVKSKTPKIIGFGLWRLIDSTKMHQTKNFKETPGYMPPEYVDIGFISNKFDVFSLGVIIIKMMAGNMGYSRCFEMSPKEFIDLVCEHWTKRLHATPEYSSYELDILRMSTCVEIALTCADADREKRPCIEDIVHKLGELETRIKTIMLLPHDHRQTLLTNLRPEPYFPRNTELYMSNNLAKDGNVTVYKSKWSRHDSLPCPSRQVVSTPHHMSLQHLRDITNNFSDERILGTGGSYAVYKGILQSGRMIAVKKLVKLTLSSQAEFEKEINLLIKLKHPNIVRLVGYCYETQYIRMHHKGEYVFAEDIQTLLCLEYLPNGSLDKHISGASSGLDWDTRCKIIDGIAYGLEYLHEHSKEPILHLDLKPANILLNESMLPTITDFGLSRLFDQSQTIQTATASGTLGYMSPEHLRGMITPTSDIFSLGVIILEVITGHRDYPYDIRAASKDFTELEIQKWRSRLQKEPRYISLETDCEQIKRRIQIGLICLNPDRTKRPTMKKIIDMLQGLESTNWYSNEVALVSNV